MLWDKDDSSSHTQQSSGINGERLASRFREPFSVESMFLRHAFGIVPLSASCNAEVQGGFASDGTVTMSENSKHL